jgi:hypothetical protein
MHLNLDPKIAAILTAQVASGHFPTVEAAVTAAVLGVPLVDDADELAWAKPLLDAADRELDQGHSFSLDEVFDEIDRSLDEA